jgi:Protein of unknown function, DUF547
MSALAAVAAVALAAAPAAGAGPATGAAIDHTVLDRILRSVVHGESVAYAALRRDHRPALDGYLSQIAAVEPERLSRAEQIALYVNLYNATVLRTVAERYRPGYRPDADSFGLFAEPLVRIAGTTMSLDDLEHRVLRAELHEPRVHAVLVCAARSCPPLAPRAYTGPDLETTLEERMRRFVSDRSRNEIDVAARTLRLSRIFDWYADDFGGPGGVAAYVGRYAGRDLTGFRIEFLPYSWELNDVPGAPTSSPDRSAPGR